MILAEEEAGIIFYWRVLECSGSSSNEGTLELTTTRIMILGTSSSSLLGKGRRRWAIILKLIVSGRINEKDHWMVKIWKTRFCSENWPVLRGLKLFGKMFNIKLIKYNFGFERKWFERGIWDWNGEAIVFRLIKGSIWFRGIWIIIIWLTFQRDRVMWDMQIRQILFFSFIYSKLGQRVVFKGLSHRLCVQFMRDQGGSVIICLLQIER